MWKFLAPPAYKSEQVGPEADRRYKSLRLQVFIGAFVGYAAFYIVRKNFSMAIPMLEPFGFVKGELGTVLAMNAVAYALSKFLMGSVSDRSDARKFLPLGLILASISMMFMIVPITALGPENHTAAIILMGALNFLVGWFNGMGWPPCGRVMTHWFSQTERGTMMSIWNCAHNVGGSLVGPMAVYGATWVAYCLLRDTPQSCGLPSVEKWRNDYPKNYSEKQEAVLSTKEIFLQYVLNNKFLWFIAIANAFVYMVRYGCLDWAPTILTEKGIDLEQAGWAYFAYEFAAIPGTLICGWMSDKVFNGRRALPTILFMAVVAVFICLYWAFIDNITIVTISLIGIGFFIYGPVMLIGVQALDLAPKNAAGTAAGLTGFFGYFFGTAILANTLIGYVAEHAGWNATFVLLLVACFLSIVFMAVTYKEEQYLAKRNKK